MKVMAINGSPRKRNWNTVTLLENVLEGARSVGAETELIQLYDMRFSGCISCFSCKKLNRKEDGVCALDDDLTDILTKIRENCDALIVGTPIYYACETAATRAFLERLFFPYNKYAKDMRVLFPRRIKSALIYTMGIVESAIEQRGYDKHMDLTREMMDRYLGPCEMLVATDTLQYSDYDKFESESFDKNAKLKRHAEVFPEVCKSAQALGMRLAS